MRCRTSDKLLGDLKTHRTPAIDRPRHSAYLLGHGTRFLGHRPPPASLPIGCWPRRNGRLYADSIVLIDTDYLFESVATWWDEGSGHRLAFMRGKVPPKSFYGTLPSAHDLTGDEGERSRKIAGRWENATKIPKSARLRALCAQKKIEVWDLCVHSSQGKDMRSAISLNPHGAAI